MTGIGQQGQGIGLQAVDDLGQDKGGIERRRPQETRTEISRSVVMVVVMRMAMIMVTVIMRMRVVIMGHVQVSSVTRRPA
jgi:hypothetical protein